jgi:YD repeat-containing protein
VSYSYSDQSGNLAHAVDALERGTTFTYDALKHRVRALFQDNTTQMTCFDEVGGRLNEQDQAGKVASFEHGSQGTTNRCRGIEPPPLDGIRPGTGRQERSREIGAGGAVALVNNPHAVLGFGAAAYGRLEKPEYEAASMEEIDRDTLTIRSRL